VYMQVVVAINKSSRRKAVRKAVNRCLICKAIQARFRQRGGAASMGGVNVSAPYIYHLIFSLV
jgi:hypothetical protein